jgi:prepilin-type N-terminal cleavage/methylation domain-containing protein
MNKKNLKKQGGFTLIELLIVIGLLGSLVALVLPSFRGARHDAVELISDYNQAGTARTLVQYRALYNQLPNNMHTGLVAPNAGTGDSFAAADVMDVPGDLLDNLELTGSRSELSNANIRSLNRVGITTLAHGPGFSENPLPDLLGVDFAVPAEAQAGSGLFLITLHDGWAPEAGGDWTFRGRTPSQIADATADEKIIALFIAPTIDWESGPEGRPVDDWTQGELALTIELEGKCPVPTDVDFRYYMAFLKVHGGNGRTRADLVGTACPECGILNP